MPKTYKIIGVLALAFCAAACARQASDAEMEARKDQKVSEWFAASVDDKGLVRISKRNDQAYIYNRALAKEDVTACAYAKASECENGLAYVKPGKSPQIIYEYDATFNKLCRPNGLALAVGVVTHGNCIENADKAVQDPETLAAIKLIQARRAHQL